jgi:hypothetical protein
MQFFGSMLAAMLVGIVPLNGAAYAAADWDARRALKDPSLGRPPVPPLLVALACACLAMPLTLVASAVITPPSDAPLAGPVELGVRTALILAAFSVTALYALRLLYRRTGSPQFALLAAWVFLTWLVPVAVDAVSWYRAQDRADVLQTASAFSPAGALIELWTGRQRFTHVGLMFQICVAAAMAAAFHLTARPPLAASHHPGPQTDSAPAPSASPVPGTTRTD